MRMGVYFENTGTEKYGPTSRPMDNDPCDVATAMTGHGDVYNDDNDDDYADDYTGDWSVWVWGGNAY